MAREIVCEILETKGNACSNFNQAHFRPLDVWRICRCICHHGILSVDLIERKLPLLYFRYIPLFFFCQFLSSFFVDVVLYACFIYKQCAQNVHLRAQDLLSRTQILHSTYIPTSFPHLLPNILSSPHLFDRIFGRRCGNDVVYSFLGVCNMRL